MFRCQQCERAVPAGHPSREVVLEVRQVTYPASMPPQTKKKSKKKRPGAIGHGWETARSARVCADCAPELEQALAGRIASLATPVEDVIEERQVA